VYGYSHINRDAKTKVLQLILEDDQLCDPDDIPLEISPKYMVFVQRIDKVVAVPASNVTIGDRVHPDGTRVQEIHQMSRNCIYAPLAFSGDNGYWCSCINLWFSGISIG
jgi:hypothetical protein